MHAQAQAEAVPAPSPMLLLQDRWYNCLIQGLGLQEGAFQISQPAAPLAITNVALWGCENVLPPASLTFDRNDFADPYFATYAAVVQQLQDPTQLEAVIGADAYAAWTKYLGGLRPTPPASQLPIIFRNWANKNGYTSVAQQGTSALLAENLFNGQKNAVLPYLGPDAQPVDFNGSYASLATTVDCAPGTTLSFDSATADRNVAGTWTGGANFGVHGLWTGSDADDHRARVFAAARVTVSCALQHFTLWTCTPGAWYSSSLLNLAYTNQGPPVWPPGASADWASTFGEKGTMLYLLGALLVVDGVTVTVTSAASFRPADQRTIAAQSASGLWPFYAASAPGAVSNSVDFDEPSGALTISTTLQPGHPAVLGGNVLSIAAYLGH